MPVDHPTRADHDLMAAVENRVDPDALSAARVILAQGRLFTPARWPTRGAPRRGTAGRCHPNALRVARQVGAVYVEGFAYAAGAAYPHAWCARPDGTVLDPTWPDGAAAAYLGVPMTITFVKAFQQRTLTKTLFVGVFDEQVQAVRDAARIFTGGVPARALVDVGRALPVPVAGWVLGP
ncbi:hypothetical protein [Kitasatospora sp. NPDC002965]|uniref:hypothetical protein n=1 Tax=Kitasatospora sp. NPDC002965 TaxID=3154775 RepID=UPI0033A58A15